MMGFVLLGIGLTLCLMLAAAQTTGITQNFQIGGFPFGGTNTFTDNAVVGVGPIQPLVAQPSTLTTRTDNVTGTLTMTNSGHGITTGQRIDLYWAGGYQMGVTVGTVSGTSVPFVGTAAGGGTNLPIATTIINVGIPQKVAFGLVEANLTLIAAQCNWEALFAFVQSDSATLDGHFHVVPGTNGVPTVAEWYSGIGASPFTGSYCEFVWISCADPAAQHQCQTACLTH